MCCVLVLNYTLLHQIPVGNDRDFLRTPVENIGGNKNDQGKNTHKFEKHTKGQDLCLSGQR